MWIEIKNDVFETNEFEKMSFLLKVLYELPKGSSNTKGNIYVDIGNILNSNLFQNLSSTDRGLIEDSLKLLAYEDEQNIKYVISNQNGYNLDEALEFFREPLWIVLENSNNDSYFIKSIINHFDDEKKYVTDCLNNRWIQFANAGGSSVKHQIKEKLSSFDYLVSTHGTNNNKYYRGFVILDSDREFLGQARKDDYNNLIPYLVSNGISWHILEKRAMENYMPDEVINEIKTKKSKSKNPEDKKCVSWINVYEHLSSEQKDFTNYVGQKPFADLDPAAQNLFQNQLTTNYQILSNGISYRDNETHGIEEDERRFKNAFPRLFVQSPLVNRFTLENRCGCNELQRIYSQIKSML